MSYHRKTLVSRVRARRGRSGMGGLLDAAGDIIGGILGTAPIPGQDDTDIAACVAQGNAAAADYDAKRADLAQNWNPNGFYAPADMNSLISQVFQMLHAADTMLTNISVADNNVKNAQDEIFRKYADVQMYQQAIAQAKAAGQAAINAPGFKDWVISAMGTASAGVTAAVATACIAPWWAGALADFQAAFDAVYNAAKRIVGIILKAGETALTIVDNSLDILKYLPYAAAAVVAYIAINELKRYKARR